MTTIARPTVAIALGAALCAAFFVRSGPRPLEPNDPIAADGSMIAGRAHTMFDSEPPLSAFGLQRSDDPADFLPLIESDRVGANAERSLFKRLLRRLDWSLCKADNHQSLVVTVQTYYSWRGREKYVYSRRGPRAKAAIEAEWSSPADQDIDNYVRHALQYGILHKRDIPHDHYDEFARTFADTEELGTGCTAADAR